MPRRPRWPMIILRTPKGWTAPKEVDGHRVEGSWRAHQVPITDVVSNPAHLKLLEQWMLSYRPQDLFDSKGRLIAGTAGRSRRTAIAASARIRTPTAACCAGRCACPDFRDYRVEVARPGQSAVENTYVLGQFLRDVMRDNMDNFRVFGPDETASNRLQAIYEASRKTWLAEIKPEDADGGELSPDGRVMEMLSEHTLEGWMEGYVLTGRHVLFNTYEAFAHIVDSMVNQHAKWLEKAKTEVSWRAPISSLNILISSTVWRQDHNGFTHQDPGFIDVVTNKSPQVTRIYLPPDANCLLSVADHCLRSTDYVNVIVADKQPHPQFLDMESAVKHCSKGIGLWSWASNDQGGEPDVVIASAGDVATIEALAAVAILREKIPDLKIRFVNVVDLFKLQPSSEHPHGLSDRDFDSLFTSRQADHFQFSRVPVADSQARLPQDQSRQPARARLQGVRQHQHSAAARDRKSDRPLQPRHRRDRSRAAAAGHRRSRQGLAEGPDSRESRLRAAPTASTSPRFAIGNGPTEICRIVPRQRPARIGGIARGESFARHTFLQQRIVLGQVRAPSPFRPTEKSCLPKERSEGIGAGSGRLWIRDGDAKTLSDAERSFPQSTDALGALFDE